CLTGTPNQVTGIFAADANGGPAGSAVMFHDAPGFTVGTIAADACALGAAGVRSNNGDINLVTNAGPLALNAGVDAGTATVRLNSGATITQTAAGIIAAGNLAAVALGTIDLCVAGAPNQVNGILAADASGGPAGSAVLFLDAPGFTVGTIAADVCAAGATGVHSNNGTIDLVSNAGPLALNAAVNAGTGTVRLNSGAGISQNVPGVITAVNLAAVAGGAIDLCVAGAPNQVT